MFGSSPQYKPSEADTALMRKWNVVLEHKESAPIHSTANKVMMARLLENQQKDVRRFFKVNASLSLNEATPTNVTGNISKWDPVLISMVRRAAPQMISGIVGTQAMTGPTGQIFAFKAHYGDNSGAELGFGAPNTAWTGDSSDGTAGDVTPVATDIEQDPFAVAGYTTGTGRAVADGEGDVSAEASVEISKILVEAMTRKIKGTLSHEVAEDMEAIHQMDAVNELSVLLNQELSMAVNRELVRSIYIVGKLGASWATTPGTFDMSVDADDGDFGLIGKFKALRFAIDREANQILVDVKRGRGNIIIASPDVVSALDAAEYLDTPMSMSKKTGLDYAWEGDTFAGMMGNYKVYVDPYTTMGSTLVIGYKGEHPFDAGLFHCPYIPFKMSTATDQDSIQPIIAFRTRYGIVSNPFVEASPGVPDGMTLTAGKNQYYRKIKVTNLGVA